MRRFSSLLIILVLVLALTSSTFAALRDSFVGDVAVVAWLESDTVKVALANESRSRVSITISSEGWDQRWRPFFLERTVVVPARSVIVESFSLSSSWRGEPLSISASTWDRQTVVQVQTQEIFNPSSYVVRAGEEVEVMVDLAFMAADSEAMFLMVDEHYYGLNHNDIGQISVRKVEGGFEYSSAKRRLEKIRPYMLLSMWAPRQVRDMTMFSFNLYKQQDDTYWNYYQNEIPGPTILVYGRNMVFQDNSHLNQPPTPPWNWRR